MVNYRKQMGALITGQMLSMILNFALPLTLVRILTQNDYGLYAQFNVILSFCTVFFSFGFSSELYYSYPLANEKGKKILVFQSLIMLFIGGLIAVCVLCIPTVKQYISPGKSLDDLYIYLIMSVWLSVPEILITALYVLNNDSKTSVLFLPIMTIIRVGLILLFYWKYPCIESVFTAVFMSVIIKFAFVVRYVLRLIKKQKWNRLIDMYVLKNQLKYSIPLGFASSIRVFVQQLDKLIILSFVTPAVYAIYSISFYGVPGLTQVYLSVSQVYIPRMAAAFEQRNLDNLIALYHSMVSKTLSYTIPIIFIMILFADPIIPFVFSSKYMESVPYFRVYLLSFIISSIGCGNILRATGETRYSLLSYIYTAIVLLPFTYFSIKYYSLNGAITAAVLSVVLPKIILSVYDAKSIKISFIKLYPWRNIKTIMLISVISIIPFVLIYLYVDHSAFWFCMMYVIIYLCVNFSMQIYYNVFVISCSELVLYVHKITRIK